MQDDSQDTGYLILSLTETMEESRRLRQELQSGARGEQPQDGTSSPEEDKPEAVPL